MKGKNLRATPEIAQNAEEIARKVKLIADGMKAFKDSKLNERAVIILVSEATGVNRSDIKKVIDQLNNLDALFLKGNKKSEK